MAQAHATAAGLPSGRPIAADFTAAGGAAATTPLLERPDRPTAIVYANDLMAIAGMSVAAQLGIDVPADLSIVGFDDVPLAAHMNPPLTTVRQDVVALGPGVGRGALSASSSTGTPSRSNSAALAAGAPGIDCTRARAREEGRLRVWRSKPVTHLER